MIAPPERSADRDSALVATLAHVPFDGWTLTALRRGLVDTGGDPRDAALLFPGGAADMVAAFCDLTDRQMEAAMAASEYTGLRTTARVRAAIALRLERNRPHREAVRRALGVLAVPGNAALAGGCTARTVEAIWRAAGDRSADFSWYTKRAILAGVYAATLLFWLSPAGEEEGAVLAFLDRRLAEVGRIGGLRRRAEARLRGLLPTRLRERLS